MSRFSLLLTYFFTLIHVKTKNIHVIFIHITGNKVCKAQVAFMKTCGH